MVNRYSHLRVIDFGDAKYLDEDRNQMFKLDKEETINTLGKMGLDDSDCMMVDAGNFSSDGEGDNQLPNGPS
jgi:hypothetical protein